MKAFVGQNRDLNWVVTSVAWVIDSPPVTGMIGWMLLRDVPRHEGKSGSRRRNGHEPGRANCVVDNVRNCDGVR